MSGPAIARSVAVGQPVDPGHDAAVVEAQDQLGAHRARGRAVAADEADDVGVAAARRHEVDHGHGAVRRLDRRFEDQRAVAIARVTRWALR